MVITNDLRTGNLPPISLQARGMRIDNIITWICRQIGTEWTYRRKAILIGETEEERPELRIYDISEAIIGIKFPGPPWESLNLGDGSDEGGAVFDLFGGGDGALAETTVGAEDLIDIIQEAVDPEHGTTPTSELAFIQIIIWWSMRPPVYTCFSKIL